MQLLSLSRVANLCHQLKCKMPNCDNFRFLSSFSSPAVNSISYIKKVISFHPLHLGESREVSRELHANEDASSRGVLS